MASYGTVAGYKSYADARGVSYAGKTDPEITAALVRASTYIDGAYRSAFPGYKTGRRAQALEWPRSDAYDAANEYLDPNTVPGEVDAAAYEGAIRELASPGSLSPDIVAGGGVVKREKVGPIETEYASNGSFSATFTTIDQALSGLLSVGSAYSGVVERA